MTAKKSLLETLKPYIMLADDLETSEPVISYCCLEYFCDKFVAGKKQTKAPYTPEDNGILTEIMNKMEATQKEQGFTKDDRKSMLEDYCGKAFATIEKEEETAPKITKAHAARFLTVSRIIDMLSSYQALTPAWEEKSKS